MAQREICGEGEGLASGLWVVGGGLWVVGGWRWGCQNVAKSASESQSNLTSLHSLANATGILTVDRSYSISVAN